MDQQTKVLDCDVFCTEDFEFEGVVRITGNFYASANVRVDGLEVGGDIYLISPNAENPACIDALYVDCNGSFYMNNFEYSIDSFGIGAELSINFTGPALLES